MNYSSDLSSLGETSTSETSRNESALHSQATALPDDAFRNKHVGYSGGSTLRQALEVQSLVAVGRRHTAATWLLTSGADLRTTSSILGHADATTTLRVYSHVVSERQRTAVALIGDVLAGIAESHGQTNAIKK